MAKQANNFRNIKAGGAGGISDHNERDEEKAKELKDRTNYNIDPERTHLNYQLHEPEKGQHKDYTETLTQRIGELKESGQLVGQVKLSGEEKKQSNVLTSFVISSGREYFTKDGKKDGEIDEEKTKHFMRVAYDYVCDLAGKENIVSAQVHLDETTPHIHVVLMPLIEATDRKGRTGLKLSTSEFWAEKLLDKETKEYYRANPEYVKVGKKDNAVLKLDKRGKPIPLTLAQRVYKDRYKGQMLFSRLQDRWADYAKTHGVVLEERKRFLTRGELRKGLTELQFKIKKSGEDLGRLSESESALLARVQEASKVLEGLEGVGGKIQKAQKQYQDLVSDYDKLIESKKGLENKVSDLEGAHVGLSSDVQLLTNQKENLAKEIETAREQAKQEIQKEIQSLGEQRTVLVSEVQELTNQKRNLVKEIATVKEEAKKEIQEAIRPLEEQRKQVLLDVQDLRKERDELPAVIQSVKDEAKQEIQEAISSLKEQRTGLVLEVEELTNQKENLVTEIATAKEEAKQEVLKEIQPLEDRRIELVSEIQKFEFQSELYNQVFKGLEGVKKEGDSILDSLKLGSMFSGKEVKIPTNKWDAVKKVIEPLYEAVFSAKHTGSVRQGETGYYYVSKPVFESVLAVFTGYKGQAVLSDVVWRGDRDFERKFGDVMGLRKEVGELRVFKQAVEDSGLFDSKIHSAAVVWKGTVDHNVKNIGKNLPTSTFKEFHEAVRSKQESGAARVAPAVSQDKAKDTSVGMGG